MSAVAFAPARMPARDEDGYAVHPDLELILEDGDEGDELRIDLEKLKRAGFEDAYVGFDDDVDDDAIRDRYFEDGTGVSEWQPTTPDGEGWQLVGVYDTENGPYAMFVRRLP